jgi:hypothetical protein
MNIEFRKVIVPAETESFRLRSVQIFVALTNPARTISDVVRPFSGSVRDRFDAAVISRWRPDRQNGNRIPLSFNFSNRAATNR